MKTPQEYEKVIDGFEEFFDSMSGDFSYGDVDADTPIMSGGEISIGFRSENGRSYEIVFTPTLKDTTHPNGSCPDCGAELKHQEADEQCSAGCGYTRSGL